MNIFDKIEAVQEFRKTLDYQAVENESGVGIAADRCDKNRVSRLKRLKRFDSLPFDQLSFLAENVDIDQFERAIYAQDKVRQFLKFRAGDRSVYGGNRVTGCNTQKKNNAFLMIIDYIRKQDEQSIVLSSTFHKNLLMRYGQPAASVGAQSGSNNTTLECFKCAVPLDSARTAYRIDVERVKALFGETFTDVKIV